MRKHILKDKKTTLLLFLTFVWMSVIFMFSAQPADESSQVSGFVKSMIINVLNTVFNGNVPAFFSEDIFSHIIRKCGHAAEYAVLGILNISWSVRVLSKEQPDDGSGFLYRIRSSGKAIIIALIISILYASSDEFHQIFVKGRGPMVTDVLLDSFSAAAGIIFKNLKVSVRGVSKRVGITQI